MDLEGFREKLSVPKSILAIISLLILSDVMSLILIMMQAIILYIQQCGLSNNSVVLFVMVLQRAHALCANVRPAQL